MKNLIILLILITSLSSYSQTTKTELLYKDKKYDISINKFDGNTGSYILWTWTFQNKEYDHIVDLGTIVFKNSEDIEKFVTDCESFLDLNYNSGQILESNKNELSHSNYSISKLADFNMIFISDKDNKYQMLSQKTLKKVLESINKSLEFYQGL